MSSVIDEIKARIDIVELVSESVQLRRSGKNYSGFCPFHSNTRTPAFAVFPESGTWRCFGQCNEGGDIFGFTMKKEGWDFSEALQFLADKAGIQLKPPTPEEQAVAEEHDQLRSLLEEAVLFYRHQMLNTQPGKSAMEYLLKRGVLDTTAEAFGLGYAPDSWDAAAAHFISKGYTESDLLEAGLVSERDSGGVYDRFRNRLLFPIRDGRGRMAGFGARILKPEDVPKFLNSPQTPVFDKGRLLYGLDRARKKIRLQDQAVIVEGYLDVIALHQAGYTNAVSPMGTALTEHQLYLLKRLTRRIVLALDSDTAGNRATLRGLEIARQTLDHESDPVFDSRGLLGYEARLQADIRVTTLPEGMDPDDVVNNDPGQWERVIEQAKPIVIHVMDTLAANRDIEDPKTKSEIAEQILPLIQEVPSPIERDTYRQRLARLLRVDESVLWREAAIPRRPPRRTPRGRPPTDEFRVEPIPGASAGNYALEAYALGVILRRPDLLYRVDRDLQKFGLNRLAPADFLHADHQAILRLFQDSVNQDIAEPLDYVMNNLSLPMMEVADDLLARTEKLDPNEDRVLSDLLRSLLDLRARNLRQDIEHLRHLMEDSQEQGDLRVEQYQQSMLAHTAYLQRLDQARGYYTTRAVSVH